MYDEAVTTLHDRIVRVFMVMVVTGTDVVLSLQPKSQKSASHGRLRTGFFSVLDPAKIPLEKFGLLVATASAEL